LLNSHIELERRRKSFQRHINRIGQFIENGIVGRKALVVSPNLFVQLQRIQPGTGTTEYDRINKLLDGNIFQLYTGPYSRVSSSNKWLMVSSEPDMVRRPKFPEVLTHASGLNFVSTGKLFN